MPDLNLHAAQVNDKLAGHFTTDWIAAGNHQRRPSQTGHAFGIAEQPRKALHLALHVLGTALDDQLVGALACYHFSSAFGNVRAGSQHAYGVVMGEQHIFDGLVADRADARNQILGHRRRRGCVADHNELFTNDDARIRITLSGVGPAMRAELLKSDDFVREVGLAGECL